MKRCHILVVSVLFLILSYLFSQRFVKDQALPIYQRLFLLGPLKQIQRSPIMSLYTSSNHQYSIVLGLLDKKFQVEKYYSTTSSLTNIGPRLLIIWGLLLNTSFGLHLGLYIVLEYKYNDKLHVNIGLVFQWTILSIFLKIPKLWCHW